MSEEAEFSDSPKKSTKDPQNQSKYGMKGKIPPSF